MISEPIIFSRRPRRAPRIDLTALVDGVFNLLIFFAVTASIGGAQAGLSLNLPEAKTAQYLKGRVLVGITPGGVTYVNARKVPLEQVGAAVTRESAGNLDIQVIVRPDRRVPYEGVVAVMDEIRFAGYHNLALAALKKQER